MKVCSEDITHYIIFSLQDTYYIPCRGRTNPGGKLYSRINYIKQSEKKRERLETLRTEPHQEEAIVSAEVSAALSWLEVNQSPWNAVLAQWEISFPSRKTQLRQLALANRIISQYPQLADDHGFQLVSSVSLHANTQSILHVFSTRLF